MITIDGYAVGRFLGRGGSGAVYEARQNSTGRAVALKLLDIDVTDAGTRLRFDRERRAMSELTGHPHIVSIIDAGVREGQPWIAMDLCPRGSLAGRGAPMSPSEALTTLRAIASALSAAHARQVLHCDVKPANILVTDYEQPALADFGIARLAVGSGSSSASASGGYTLDHAAPEVLDGRRSGDRADVYSLGTTVWQLLAARPPFRRDEDASAAAVMRRIMMEPLPATGRADIPPEFTELLAAMTAKMPDARPTAAQVVQRVDAVAAASGLAVAAVPVSVPFPRVQADPLAPHSRTDDRPELADLTRSGRGAARAAPIPKLPREAGETGRDRVVVVAVVALAALAVALGGLVSWRVGTAAAALPAPASAPALAPPAGLELIPAGGVTAPPTTAEATAAAPSTTRRRAPRTTTTTTVAPPVVPTTRITTTTTQQPGGGGGGLFPGEDGGAGDGGGGGGGGLFGGG
ncbi:serine/threonine-protein kinase [Actinomycetospora flava]|uniref:non-specific serine/threonine protein kinase n=1 Tax=Actinomycetospora flava TaxID=3129232 RepID=A0ABU8M9G9_9PSEU